MLVSREGVGMVRSFALTVASGILVASAGAALAQVAGGGGPPLGSTNAGTAAGSTRDQQAGYNRVIGGLDHPQVTTGLKGKAAPATVADLKVGSHLRDVAGVPIGTVVAVDASGATVDTGKTKIKVPTVAFGKDDYGLLLGITAARFGDLVAKASASN
jgi:hypothetical protein